MSVLETNTATGLPSQARVRRRVFVSLVKNPLTAASLVVLAIFVVVAILEPWILPFPPKQVRFELMNAAPFTTEYVLGGDRYGRDILSRLIASTRPAVLAASVLSLVAVVIGVTAGLIAGYFGKIFETISDWLFSVLLAVPAVVVLISLYTVLGTSTAVAMGVFGVLVAPQMYLMVRTLTRAVRKELYVDAARVSGLPNRRIVGRHVLIAIRAPVILMIAGLAGLGIAVQAGLEVLGLGEPLTPSWGSMLADAFGNIYIAPEQLIWPGLALGLVTGAFSLVSIGLRDVLEDTYVKPSARSQQRREERIRLEVAPILKKQDSGESSGAPDADAARAVATKPPLLSIENLSIAYSVGSEARLVVSDVSLTVDLGEVVGVVGESGSGKTQTVFAALGLLPDEAVVVGGSIKLDGRELVDLPERELRRLRGVSMAYVPQEPMANLDPSFTVGSQLLFGIRSQTDLRGKQARELALSMLERVGIKDPTRVFRSYPHEISGGMAQRVLIAGAVAGRPQLLVADEPTTALDVTIQAEVLDLLRDLQQETKMGVLIVTHNFGVVADLCQRVFVMRDGAVVEQGAVEPVFSDPQHPYTRMLLGAVLDNAPPRSEMRKEVR